MWERNTESGVLDHIVHDFKIKRSRKSGKLFAYNERGDFELEGIDRKKFLWDKYHIIILMVAGFILLDVFLYSFLYLLIIVAIELFIHYKKRSICKKHIKTLFNIFKVVLVAEIVVFASIFAVNPMYFLLTSTLISSVIVFNFYLFARFLLFSKEIIFNEVYKLKEHDGFFVWRRQVC